MRNILFTLALLVSFSSCRQTSFEYFERGFAKDFATDEEFRAWIDKQFPADEAEFKLIGIREM